MILEQWVVLTVRPKDKAYYESKGYICDIIIAPSTWQILCHIDDVSYGSSVKVTRICDDCGSIQVVSFNKHQFEVCKSCRNKRKEKHYPHCSRCDKELTHYTHKTETPLCRECWKETNRGENHPSWKSELTEEERDPYKHKGNKEFGIWVKSVREHCNYTCIKCGVRENGIATHHIFDRKHYPELIYDVNNGICMCNSCHSIFHSIYTNKRNGGDISTPELLLMYLKEYEL